MRDGRSPMGATEPGPDAPNRGGMMAGTTDTLPPPASAQEISEARALAAEAGLSAPDHALVRLVRSARSRRHLVAAGAIQHRAIYPGWDRRGQRGRGGAA